MPRLGILISGGGSNMVALLRACQAGEIAAEPVLVLSNRPEAPGLAKAEAAGIATASVDHTAHAGDRGGFSRAIDAALTRAEVDLVACAGFMRILSDEMVTRWAGRMVNIHPSLLPAFKGLDTHARALEAGCAWHGCTVHEVSAELDSGRILGQAAVPVRPGDSPASLAARVLEMEHRLYPQVLAAFAADPAGARATPIALIHPACNAG
ncbi:MAG: phosphoribosylglycinamide formyltransferase [Pseudomonadota bacterium]